ncbi:hypothetical protein ACFMPF_10520 [Citrobacter sp. S5]|uniref:hypothetical protein n=1 Tax=Citrobacter sp. S5 TaxID=3351561 RepID=UPI001A1EAD6E|nr:hypothetical protein [Citrobacter freundii]
MRDIYHQLVKHSPDFKSYSDDDLIETADVCAETARAIANTLTLIGNLALEATLGEECSNENARRDLMLLGDTLRNLPRLAEAMEQNSCTANFVLRKRRGEVLQ